MQPAPSLDESAPPATRAVPFRIRGRSFAAIVLEPQGLCDDAFLRGLEEKLRQAPHFFQNAPFVLDLGKAQGVERSGDMVRLVRELRARRLALVGIQNGNFDQNTAALSVGLVPLQSGREIALGPDEKPVDAPPESGGLPQPEEPDDRSSLVLTEPVRSGQRVFVDRGDLVVLTAVGSGAELIAHGHIHVYGPLRGRALAGVNGDTTARIFCQSMEAELVAIAGLYKTSDDIGPELQRQRVQAWLEADTLRVAPLK